MKKITIHKASDFQGMRKAGSLAARVLDYITDYVKPGVSTEELNELCHNMIIQNNAIPAPLNYNGFPKSICTSVNHVVCHGIPNKGKILQNGDIVNVDITVILDGWHGDTSRMYEVGDVSIKAKKLIDTTLNAMLKGISVIKPGVPLNQIGKAIEEYVKSFNYSVVRDFCGHGIGKIFHDTPQVLHYYDESDNTILEQGMFFTVEPMVNAGKSTTKILNDGWTAVTRDKSLSAQFEHTLGVTQDGVEIFTLSDHKQKN